MNVEDWFKQQKMEPSTFQKQVWKQYAAGKNGLLIAPTGAGKTFALMGAVAGIQNKKASGLQLLWISPLRALASDIAEALQVLCDGVGLGWQVELRVGDTSSAVKARQRKHLPEVLVTTPESLHIMLSYPKSTGLFKQLQCTVVDEWHDLLPTKRGVMMQLALSHLHTVAPSMQTWGISATIGNPKEAMQILLAAQDRPAVLIRDKTRKIIESNTVIPKRIDRFPWAGHMGDALLEPVLKIVQASCSCLIFTNTRNQAETWYRKLLSADKDLAGRIALHHGSLPANQRTWVEKALHEQRLQAVICTSSLDLGVDFRPVDTIIQIGSPKGIARYIQRGGRSGHAPGETSRIYFVPTHALELFEAGALKKAIIKQTSEPLQTPKLSLDVLTQWLVTLGIGDGFSIESLRDEVRRTAAYADLTAEAWQWVLAFVTTGGAALGNYAAYRKLKQLSPDFIQGAEKDVLRRHRQNIGTITSSSGVRVQVLRGSIVGSIEESFAGSLQPGQVFWLGGRAVEFVRLRDMTVWVRPSKLRRGITPSWTGGRLPYSSSLAELLRTEVGAAARNTFNNEESRALRPLISLQRAWSHVPTNTELLVEQFNDRAGHHIVVYPMEGRAVHDVLAMLWALRLGKDPNTFSTAVNDFGFELLAAEAVSFDESVVQRLLSTKELTADIQAAVKSSSLPRRQFRSIATVAGLISKGTPGKPQSNRHLQASSEMVYDVLQKYDPGNKLLEQAYVEVIEQVVDITRIRQTLMRLSDSDIVIKYPPHPTPFAFPLLAERLRERLSTETLTERLQRMQARLERYAAGV